MLANRCGERIAHCVMCASWVRHNREVSRTNHLTNQCVQLPAA